jgi:hypothetical protein
LQAMLLAGRVAELGSLDRTTHYYEKRAKMPEM